MWYGPKVLIDGADAKTLSVGETVTFINWGNIVIRNIKHGAGGEVESLAGDLDLENTDYKKTQKLTWLAETNLAPFTPTVCVHYDHIITKPILGKEENFKEFINGDSKVGLGKQHKEIGGGGSMICNVKCSFCEINYKNFLP